MYSQLLEHGFRRSGNLVYKPLCRQCSACIPVRIVVDDFRPSRSQKRILRNQGLISVKIKPQVFEQIHYDLYLKYQQVRHPGGGMADSNAEEYFNFLSSSWCNTLFVEFYIDGALIAVAIVDQLNNVLSAVYTFFDPEFSQYGLGNYAILWQIQYAQKMQIPWLYLGYWIRGCNKMSYKSKFRPFQAFIDEEWQELEKARDY
jgi:arginine-tRNA-protein transferase